MVEGLSNIAPLEYRVGRLSEVDIFVAEVATSLCERVDEDSRSMELLGSLRGPRLVSSAIKEQMGSRGFHGQLKDLMMVCADPDKKLLPAGIRKMPERVTAFDVTVEMFSSGRGHVGAENVSVVLYAPPPRFFQDRYYNSPLYYTYLDQGEPRVLFSTAVRKSKNAVDGLRVSASRNYGWARRLEFSQGVVRDTDIDGSSVQPIVKRSSFRARKII